MSNIRACPHNLDSDTVQSSIYTREALPPGLCWKFNCIHFVNMVTKSLLLLAALWTSIVNADSMEETIKRNPPRNISITHRSLGEYTFSWEGNCTCTGNIKYQLDYTYLDSKDSKMETYFVQKHQKDLDLELHRGLHARVRLKNRKIASRWTERTFNLPGESFASVDNLICIFYGELYMNCSWDVTEDASEDARFILSYRERNPSDVFNCADYLVDGGRNIGCVNENIRIEDTIKIIICISEVNKEAKLPYCRIVNPFNSYKLDSPINVMIDKSTDEVKWTLPTFDFNTICYTFQLNCTNLNDGNTKLENVTSTNHIITRDHTKEYSLHVRAAVNDKCFESHFWSDWSKSLVIGKG
ncbi:interleukin-5 receptor subunit alpha-like isoform X2 [Amblyraja radiata]|uniref:interleukin-5 receptor subunit alpha-like isoform X2 n=1 Tax=Amblyraja radiata TaxID=386614 RepID=UPI001402B54C|nr:interleukin-5 receptor subunit alpha-like isoform X2 [Amblyraja radiata]